ncbi:MAG: pre-peptidase C-terminal domain-containing protein [Magnetococcales bacterium]|nr:pre-peptidase C-terminal domain-containing protein [Magnetococcales bacterium]
MPSFSAQSSRSSVLLKPADDYGASVASAVLVSTGVQLYGQIETSGDQDWFALYNGLSARLTYVIQLQIMTDARFAPALQLMESDGDATARLVSDDSSITSSKGAVVAYTPDRDIAGAVIAVQGNLSGQQKGGQYILTVASYANIGQNSLTAGVLTTPVATAPFQGVANIIEQGGDQDWFKITLSGNRSYRFTLAADTSYPMLGHLDPYLRLIDTNSGAVVYENDNLSSRSKNAAIDITTDRGGAGFYVAAGGARTTTGAYVLQVELTDDYQSTLADATSMTIATVQRGRIEQSNDRDCFALKGSSQFIAGHRYRMVLTADEPKNLTPKLQLMSSNALTVTEDNNPGRNGTATVLYTPTTTGDFYLSAQGVLKQVDSRRDGYALLVTDFGVDVGQGVTTAAAETISASAALSRMGIVDGANDQDWFKIALVAGQRYQFDLKNDGSVTGLRDPSLRLLNAYGDVVGQNDDRARNQKDARIVLTPSQSGDYYLSAEGVKGYTGSYLLSAAMITA